MLSVAWPCLLFTCILGKIDKTLTEMENEMQEDNIKLYKDIDARIEQLRGFL